MRASVSAGVDLKEKRERARKVLEHMKTFVSTYFFANALEQRQFLDLVFSNISLTGGSPLFTTQNWLQEASLRGFVPNCGPYGTKLEQELS